MESTLLGGHRDLAFQGVKALASVMLIIMEWLPTCLPGAHLLLDWGWAEVT